MIEIKSLTLDTLKEQISLMGEPSFRAKQIYKWLHLGIESFDEITNISKDLRIKLSEKFILTVPTIKNKQTSEIDGTIKYLWELSDGSLIESVLMQYNHGISACVSNQVGCAMGCSFCVSGSFGLTRSLSSGEILDQIIFMNKDNNINISNIVMMGSGEPLDNYDNVLTFIKNVNNPDGLNIGQRHITLSTSGLAPKIDMLAKEKLQINLAISLHSTDNEARSKIMPVNKAYNIETLIKACNNYFDITGRRITYEYAMIDKVSDTDICANSIIKLFKGQNCQFNLIPLNGNQDAQLKRSSKENIKKFTEKLNSNGINATVRRTLGPDIDASCGQLRGSIEGE